MPLPTWIRLRVTTIYSGVPACVALFVDLVAGIDVDGVPADVAIDRVVALILSICVAAVTVVVVVRIIVGVTRVWPIVSVGVIRRPNI